MSAIHSVMTPGADDDSRDLALYGLFEGCDLGGPFSIVIQLIEEVVNSMSGNLRSANQHTRLSSGRVPGSTAPCARATATGRPSVLTPRRRAARHALGNRSNRRTAEYDDGAGDETPACRTIASDGPSLMGGARSRVDPSTQTGLKTEHDEHGFVQARIFVETCGTQAETARSSNNTARPRHARRRCCRTDEHCRHADARLEQQPPALSSTRPSPTRCQQRTFSGGGVASVARSCQRHSATSLLPCSP
jgi:hypothetical protein